MQVVPLASPGGYCLVLEEAVLGKSPGIDSAEICRLASMSRPIFEYPFRLLLVGLDSRRLT